jgi:hypothetical protein
MKRAGIIVLMILTISCDGKLTDEQRKRMHEQMELHKIKRITDPEITEAAFVKGRSIIKSLEHVKSDSSKIDSILNASHGRIRWLIPGKGNALALEQQLIDAYIADESGAMQDNIQDVRNGQEKTDSLLYTKPVMTKLADGSERLEGVWNIWLSRKELILAMDK